MARNPLLLHVLLGGKRLRLQMNTPAMSIINNITTAKYWFDVSMVGAATISSSLFGRVRRSLTHCGLTSLKFLKLLLKNNPHNRILMSWINFCNIIDFYTC
jgi:hypothetical protein